MHRTHITSLHIPTLPPPNKRKKDGSQEKRMPTEKKRKKKKKKKNQRTCQGSHADIPTKKETEEPILQNCKLEQRKQKTGKVKNT